MLLGRTGPVQLNLSRLLCAVCKDEILQTTANGGYRSQLRGAHLQLSAKRAEPTCVRTAATQVQRSEAEVHMPLYIINRFKSAEGMRNLGRENCTWLRLLASSRNEEGLHNLGESPISFGQYAPCRGTKLATNAAGCLSG